MIPYMLVPCFALRRGRRFLRSFRCFLPPRLHVVNRKDVGNHLRNNLYREIKGSYSVQENINWCLKWKLRLYCKKQKYYKLNLSYMPREKVLGWIRFVKVVVTVSHPFLLRHVNLSLPHRHYRLSLRKILGFWKMRNLIVRLGPVPFRSLLRKLRAL